MQENEALIQSHRAIQYYNLIEWGALKTNTHLGTHPFDANKDLEGDFIYSTNKNIKRYSPLYPALTDHKYIALNCSMDMGYTDLLVCKKLELMKGSRLMAEAKYPNQSQEHGGLENKYVVFQDPFTKIFEHGPHDILFISDTLETAREFAIDFAQSTEISTLMAQVKLHIYWH